MTITKIWFEDSALFLEELPANEAYKTEWRGLTTPEVKRIAFRKELWLEHEDGKKLFDWFIFARVIEAKLREKNNG